MSPEWRVKSDGRYYRGIRANPDLGDGPATKYVGYFRSEKRPGQSIANTRRSLRFRSRAELHSDRFSLAGAQRCNGIGATAYCTGCQKYPALEVFRVTWAATTPIPFRDIHPDERAGTNGSILIFSLPSPSLSLSLLFAKYRTPDLRDGHKSLESQLESSVDSYGNRCR